MFGCRFCVDFDYDYCFLSLSLKILSIILVYITSFFMTKLALIFPYLNTIEIVPLSSTASKFFMGEFSGPMSFPIEDIVNLRTYFYSSPFYLLFFFTLALGLSFLIIGVSYFLVEQKPDLEKNSGYECGFDPFSDARDPFHVRFYLVSILFIIFDIETVFFFPWVISFSETSMIGFYTMSIFIFILIIGFLYEWKKNALEWD